MSSVNRRSQPIHSAVRTCIGALVGAALAAAAVGGSVRALQSDEGLETECKSNMKQIGLGVLMYVQDYDEMLPPMRTALQVQHRVMPYVKNVRLFKCPASGLDYQPNPALNYRPLASIQSPASTILFRDAAPHKMDDGKSLWNLAYMDGHVASNPTEPKLGAPAPDPPPPTRATRLQHIRAEVASLRAQRRQIDAQIARLLARERQLRRGE